MKNSLFKNLLFLGFFLTFGFIQAQSISGTVSDASGPLPGANVLLKNSNNGTTTDFDGNYTINNVTSTDVLVFSYVGFVTKEVTIGNQSTINITLIEDSALLDEVVVVGYGTQSREEVTGAISSVSSEELLAVPVATADQALQGRAAGVTVINSGSPGSAPSVKIRGLGTVNNSNPLYVIDGVIAQGLGDLNVNDIASINVLKDASTTAVYGSRGANGVVMVTTKKGSQGKTKISFDTYAGVQTITKRYDLLNTEQYLQYANDAFGFIPTTPSSTSGRNTDWQDEIFKSGLMQNYNLSVSGGSEDSNFRISAGYADQEGAIIETGFERYTFRANSDFNLGDKIKIGQTAAIAFSNQTPESQSGGRSLIEHAIKSAPYLSVYNTSNLGGFQGPSNSDDGQDAENPVRVQTLGNALNKSVAIIGNIYAQYEIIEGLKFKTQVGIENRTYNNNRFTPSYNDDSVTFATGSQPFAQITKNSGTYQNVLLTNSLNYTKTFNEIHNFEFLLLSEKTDTKTTFTNASSRNNITNDVEELNNTDPSLGSGSNRIVRIGYLGRLNYNYDDKYIFAASIRRDASSKFGDENRWGWFPSVAAGWNIANEDFMADTNFSNLKLRASWGIVGNDGIPDYGYQATIVDSFNYPIEGSNAVGATPNNIPNPNLKWEETSMLNVGLDVGLFNDQFTASLEYYNNTSDDLLFNVPLTPSLGPNQPFISQNIGSVETKGFELNLGYNDYEGDFTWSANLNLGTSENEVIELNGSGSGELPGGNFEGSNISQTTVGESMFYFFGFEMDGIYQTQAEVDAVLPGQTDIGPGDVRYIDQNNDGAINDDDRVKIGNPYPTLTYGLNINTNYKNWDLSLFVNGVSGNDIYNTNTYDLEGMPRLFNSGTAVLNRWNGAGTSNTTPQAFNGDNGANTSVSTRFVENGAFTRLKNISLGYSVPIESVTDCISKLRIYVSGQNLITLTDYSGLDPEIGPSNVFGADQRFELGIDRGNYPQPKSVLIGIQASF